MSNDQDGINIKQQESRRLPIDPVFLILGLVVVILIGFGQFGRDALAYEREAIESGAWWRLFSSHLVHLNGQHGILNLVALLLIGTIAGRDLASDNWLSIAIICFVGVGFGLWYFAPYVSWYVGLSGVLHGLLAAYAVSRLTVTPLLSIVIIAALLAKLAYEQFAGPLPGLRQLSGGSVIVDAHLFGAISGVAAALLDRIRVRARAWL